MPSQTIFLLDLDACIPLRKTRRDSQDNDDAPTDAADVRIPLSDVPQLVSRLHRACLRLLCRRWRNGGPAQQNLEVEDAASVPRFSFRSVETLFFPSFRFLLPEIIPGFILPPATFPSPPRSPRSTPSSLPSAPTLSTPSPRRCPSTSTRSWPPPRPTCLTPRPWSSTTGRRTTRAGRSARR